MSGSDYTRPQGAARLADLAFGMDRTPAEHLRFCSTTIGAALTMLRRELCGVTLDYEISQALMHATQDVESARVRLALLASIIEDEED